MTSLPILMMRIQVQKAYTLNLRRRSNITRVITTKVTATNTTKSLSHVVCSSVCRGSSITINYVNISKIFNYSSLTTSQLTNYKYLVKSGTLQYRTLATTSSNNNTPPNEKKKNNGDDDSNDKARDLNINNDSSRKYDTKNSSNNYDKSADSAATSDPPIVTWVDDYLPKSFHPYARLARMDKPIGTWLLLWPCYWSTAIAAPLGSFPDPMLLSLFTVGAFVMRGAGCTINDMWDQDFDKQVARTQSRPLAKGDLTQQQALAFLAAQLSVGLAVLLSLPNTLYCFQWGASSLPLVVVYPLMKRYTNWPQLVLGLTFNWGAWMGWAATYGAMDWSIIVPLYGSGVTWTLVYDTIYANQDKDDDAKLGLKSTALTFGSNETTHKRILHGFAALTYLQWLTVGYMADFSSSLSFVPHAVGMTAAYSHLVWQIQTADLNNPHNLAERFRSNTTVGGIVFLSLVAGKVMV